MIIKQTQIKAGTARQATRYAVERKSNEKVDVLAGDADALADYADFASKANRNKYSLRHFIISPDQALKPGQLKEIFSALKKEWGFGDRPYLLTKHLKPGETDRDAHYHLMIAENATNGKVLDSKNKYYRNEKISRLLEAKFGHEIIQGKHNKAVLKQINKEIHDLKNNNKDSSELQKLKDKVESSNIHLEQSLPPAITSGAKHKAARLGYDVEQLAQDVRRAAAYNDFAQVQQLLKDQGMHIEKGEKEGVLVVKYGDEMIGSLSRLCDLTKEQSSSLYKQVLDDPKSFLPDPDPDYQKLYEKNKPIINKQIEGIKNGRRNDTTIEVREPSGRDIRRDQSAKGPSTSGRSRYRSFRGQLDEYHSKLRQQSGSTRGQLRKNPKTLRSLGLAGSHTHFIKPTRGPFPIITEDGLEALKLATESYNI